MVGSPTMKCNSCRYRFVQRKTQKIEMLFRSEEWFWKYISEGYSVRQIAELSGKPEHFVRSDIRNRLDTNEIHCIDEVFQNVRCLMIDGYTLPWWEILLVYRAYNLWKTVWFSIAEKEGKDVIIRDLRILRDSFRYNIEAFVVDGWPSILAAIREIYPKATIQRCLVHVQRQVFNYVSRNPKTEAGKDLVRIMNYSVLSDPSAFSRLFEEWKEKHFLFLIEKSVSYLGRRIFTHTSLRKAMRHIGNALPNMYHFASDPEIEKSTNKLEWFFWVLTEEWILEHKWLSRKRLRSFVALWIYFRNNR